MNHSLRRFAGIAACLALALLLAAALPERAFAQHGTIRGVVTDAATGDPLPGVNVFIEGTTLGGSTGMDGSYVIIGVRPDTYNVIFSFIGYESVRFTDVRVRIDLSTTLNAQLREEVIQGTEVVVTAERSLVQRDLTASTAVVSGEDIRALPVENFQDVVNLQAGVVNGHFRGGRTGEVGYWVDGLPVTDVFNGALGVGIENSMVQEMQVITGAFNAEFGQAMSGIVNVVTRDGDNTFRGSASGFLGDYLSPNNRVFSNLDAFDAMGVRNAEADFSGPILRNRLFFFGSGRYFHNDGWIYGRNVFGFDDVGVDATGRRRLLNPAGSGDSSIVAMNPYDRLSGQFKLSAQVARGIRLSGNVIASEERFRADDHNLLFLPEARQHRNRFSRTGYLKWTHMLSNRTFYEAGFTNNYSRYREFLFEDPLDPRYRPNENFGFEDPSLTSYFRVGGTNNGRFFRSTDTYLLKLDLTSQVNNENMIKVGGEVRRHTLTYLSQTTVVEEGRDPFLFTNGDYRYQPIEFSAYVQDKLEMGGLIVNAGLRFDYFDSKGIVFRDPRDPNAVFMQNRLAIRDADGNVIGQRTRPDGTPDYTPAEFFRPADATWQISPRLGVAFPITAGGVIHFSYGHFFQIPNFEYLYQNPYFQLSSAGSGLIGLVGNANLKPEQTINGEIGLKQELSSSSAVEVTAYYRDIRNLTGTATDPIQITGSAARYGMLINSDFGFVRGVVVRYNQRLGQDFFGALDYTFQVAKANASDPAQVYNAAAARQQLETQIVSTNWDQRHTANLSLSYNNPRLDAGFSMVASFGSGEPYTPFMTTQQTGTILPTKIPLNSERKPTTFNVNLNAFKNFTFGRHQVQVFSRIDNLLDSQNEYGVFGDTGRGTYSLQRNVDEGVFRGDPMFLEQWYTRPHFFSQPRRVVLGVQYRF
jgi:outer membrane receptor protein involved in Fe transport